MHMADALISPAVGGTMWAVSIGAVAYSVRKINKSGLEEKKVPLMGIMGAFVFAAQMINFSIPGTGSSGHIGGGILLAAILGPSPALLTISVVLSIQALLFADGGLIALGCNIFNLGVIPCFIGYPLIFRKIVKRNPTELKLMLASISSVVVSLEIGAFCVVLLTLFSGITALPFKEFILLMLPIHFAIGVAEGVVTAAVLIFVHKMRPEIMENVEIEQKGSAVSSKLILISLLVITIITAGYFSLHASNDPDGLEWSVEKVTGSPDLDVPGDLYERSSNFQEKTSLLPDYDFREDGTAKGYNGTSFSGLVGSGIIFLISGFIGWLISRNRKMTRQKEQG